MNCTNPIRIYPDDRKYPQGLKVPCQKCLNCIIQKRTEWTLRLWHELGYHEKSVFLTLTYNDENNIGTLSKRHLQLFFKRLRKRLGEQKIKYFAVGEYGEKMLRPHYHSIVFGLGLDKDSKQAVFDSWPYASWNEKPYLKKHCFGTVTSDSIQYVAKYLQKQLGDDFYEDKERPFRIISQGIGKSYLLDNIQSIKQKGYIKFKGSKRSLPRYYVKKGNIDIEEISRRAIDKECELVESFAGINTTQDEAYNILEPSQVLALEKDLKSRCKQVELNRQKLIKIKDKRKRF